MKICEWLRSNKLSLNALKTEFMIIGSHQRVGELGSARTLPVVRAQGNVIKRVNKTKSLGLVIDEFLTWDKHIEYIIKKIRQNLGMMKKIKGSVPKDSLVTLYKTLVEPYLRYGNIIWGQCGNTLTEKVQRLQNKAARIISGTSFEETNHDDLLRELNWMNVKQLISHDLAVAMFKLRNGLSPSQCTENLQTISEIHGYQTRSVTSNDYYLQKFSQSYGQKAFTYIGAKTWNNLPIQVKNAHSLFTFKKTLKEFLMKNTEMSNDI